MVWGSDPQLLNSLDSSTLTDSHSLSLLSTNSSVSKKTEPRVTFKSGSVNTSSTVRFSSVEDILKQDKAIKRETSTFFYNGRPLDTEDYSGIISKDSLYLSNNTIDVLGVRIFPSMVSFRNAFENQTYVETMSVQNISRNPVTVRIYNPRAWAFRITPLERGHLLAPGLSITRNIHYTCSTTSYVQSTLPIYVNDECFELPLKGYKGQAFVEIIPCSINFGHVDISRKPIEKSLTITNVSSCATKFLIDLGRNELNLHVKPLKGWIRPHNSVVVYFQLIVLEVGEMASEVWVTTDLSQTRVHVSLEACKRSLIVLHPNTTSDFTLLAFPRTFYNCKRYQTVVVYNMAATSSAFVVLTDCGNKVFEPILTADKEGCKDSQIFHIDPAEGYIRPFEGRIFTIWFQPKAPGKPTLGWKSKCVPHQQDFLCTIRITRLQVEDQGNSKCEVTQPPVQSPNINKIKSSLEKNCVTEVKPHKHSLSVALVDDVSVLLCLYGEADEAILSVVPDTLYFAETPVGEKKDKVVHIINKSRRTLAFRYKKIPYIEVSPSFQEIPPQSTVDVGIVFCARSLGLSPNEIEFHVLAPTSVNSVKDEFQVVNNIKVTISLKIKSEKVVPKPKFNTGITPKITHEVGFLTDDVTYNSELRKPKCAMVSSLNKKNRPWLNSSARIAFPNDMPKSLRSKPTDNSTKSIFKGLERYVPPIDTSITYTPDQILQKKSAGLAILKYIRGTAAVSTSTSTDVCCKLRTGKQDPDPPLTIYKKPSTEPQDVLVPLTFVQLYHIKVFPLLIAFGSVTTSKKCSQSLCIDNRNNFKICAKIIPLTSEIEVQLKEYFVVNANTEVRVMLTFLGETLGKYSGTVTCVINGFHSFDIAVLAQVVNKSLSVLPSDRVEYRHPESPFSLPFIPIEVQNPLNASMIYSWSVPEGSPFKVEPTMGVAPRQGKVLCAAYFEPTGPNYKLHPLKLMVEDEVSHKLKSSVVLNKPKVYFLESTLNVGNIPFNLSTVKQFVVFNPDFSDSMFVILNKKPIPGVTVEPVSGLMKARSCLTFSLNLRVKTQGALDFVVFMNCQNSTTIEMKVVGNVIFPQIEISPKYICLTRTYCNSSVKTPILLENKSKARAVVGFDMEDFSQFKVSMSRDFHDQGVPNEGINLEPGAFQKIYLHFIPKDLTSYDFILPVVLNNQSDYNVSSRDIELHIKKIKSDHINSSRVKDKKIVGESQDSKTSVPRQSEKFGFGHIVMINVSVLSPVLELSQEEITFDTTGETKQFSVTNVCHESIKLSLHIEDLYDAFQTEAAEGQVIKENSVIKSLLMPGKSLVLKSTFTSDTAGSFISDIQIALCLHDHEKPYTKVRLHAVLSPLVVIESSLKNLYFTQIPLSTDLNKTFHINVNNRKNSEVVELSYKIDVSGKEPLIVDFPEGKTVLANAIRKIPIKVTFCSKTPLSIRRIINFKAGSTGKCFVNVITTADNCLLSTHSFLQLYLPAENHLRQSIDLLDLNESGMNINKDHHSSPLNVQRSNKLNRSKPEHENSSSNSASLSGASITPGLVSPAVKRKDIATQSDSKAVGKNKQVIEENRPEMLMPRAINIKDESSLSEKDSERVRNHHTRKLHEEVVFPMCPSDSSFTEYAVHLRRSCQAVQDWVYEQVFNCSYYLVLGSQAFSTFAHSNKEYGRTTPVATRNIFDVLERICGRGVRRYFTSLNKLPEEGMPKAVFSYTLYKQFLDFMVAQGAFLAHVEPKFLLGYEDYVNFCSLTPTNRHTYNIDDEGTLDQESFKSVSTQCWLDVFLQIYKTLVLAPSVGLKVGGKESESSKRLTCICHDVDLKKNIHGKAEEVLLSWLTHKYNTQSSVIWTINNPGPRFVNNFESDLEDCLVLITVTAIFCPFLISTHFENLFLQPKTVSQAYHNAICLVTAWQTIRIGFSVTPRDFVRPNSIKMLMLVAHLYKVLPSYKPETTVKFSAVLNSSDSQVVKLENVEDCVVSYLIEIIPQSSSFTLESSKSLVLKRGRRGEICVRFTARTAVKARAVLLICGACMPPKFGRNYVFTLEGDPVELPVSALFTLISPLNIASNTQLTIESPHRECHGEENIEYDIWITYKEPRPDNLEAVSWSKERKRKVPRRLFVLSESLTVSLKDRKVVGVLDVKVCCFSQAVYNYWLVLKNAEVGDFIVKLVVKPGPPQTSSTLRVILSPESRCSCRPDTCLLNGCSRLATVNIPCRNLDQWTAVRTMFELTISDSEKEFWATYLESNIGFRLLQWMMEEKREDLSQEIELIFRESKSYNVSCKSQHVVTVSSLDIANVRSKTSVPLQIHVSADATNHSTLLTLTSSDGQEIRSYNLYIFCDY